MNDLARFIIFMGMAFALFVVVIFFVTRKRDHVPRRAVFLIAVVVVVGGMLFARYCHIYFPDVPWWIYYGVPALTTFLLPPLALRMTRGEIARYVPLGVMMAPIIHLFFSLFVGWHDYMPFPFRVPSLRELLAKYLW